MKKSIMYRLNPFNNDTNVSAVEYTIKKLAVFALIYCFSAVLEEGIIIGVLCHMGYDPLHGVMPAGQIGEMLPYYGFLVFVLVTLAYCRFVEKKTMQSIGFSGNVIDYFAGALLAVILLAIIVGVCCIFDSMVFMGVQTNANFKDLFLWILAFGMQGAAEEVMCRGFLLHSLKEKIAIPMAVAISSSAFVFPHLPSLFDISLDELVLDKIPAQAGETAAKSEILRKLEQKVLTDENRKKAKRGFKIAAIIFGILVVIDVISMIVYFGLYGFLQ